MHKKFVCRRKGNRVSRTCVQERFRLAVTATPLQGISILRHHFCHITRSSPSANMGQKVSRSDFERTYTEEPHASRRKEILKKHPEIKTLFGPDPMLAVWITLVVALQFSCLFVAVNLSWPLLFLMTYVVGGTFNHTLQLGIHELAHNLAFGHSWSAANRVLGIFCNLPIGIPSSVTFRPYHLEHHKFQGQHIIDADIPTELEGKLFNTTFGKLIWVFLQPFFYGFRPWLTNPKPITRLEIVNAIIQFSYNAAIFYFFGIKAIFYMIGGSILGMGCHPVAGHFIAEHYMFTKGQETYSYYGPLNMLCFNVGYHNEHHDFPFVPGSRLPQVRAMAPEFYDTLPRHESWVMAIYNFVMDPSIGPYARMVRESPTSKHTVTADDTTFKGE